ncbi:glycosyltransferase [Azospirillum halopraeferens]|uniref:glycosyltransferase n=1 Tax=Azospirillum halopraeferens TaxID=34010 RepID=UPI0009FD5D20|nr:glycosyltransferase family 2 protein [Azospirillum halopraeferens]
MATVAEALAAALDHLRAGRLAEAEILYTRILDVEPEEPEALHRLGLVHARRGDTAAAAALIGRAAARDDADPDALFNLGVLHHIVLRTEEAIACYRRAVARRPDFPDAEYHLSEALQAMGRIGEALEVLERLTARHPDHQRARRQRGSIEAALGRPGAAVAFLEEAVALDPGDTAARDQLAEQLAVFARRRTILDAAGPDGRHDLRDVTVLVPFRRDSDDRARNLRLIVGHLLKHADTTVLIGEDRDGPGDAADALGPELAARCRHLHLTGNATPFTHKAFLINRMVEAAQTPVVALHDTDVVVDPVQYVLARDAVRAGAAMVFPYNGLFFWIMGQAPVEQFARTLSSAALLAVAHRHPVMHSNSPGGSAFFDRAALLAAGGYNERFLSWGYEDDEIVERMRRLGQRVERVPGPLFHLEHARPLNSSDANPFLAANRAELERIRAASPETIRADIAAGRLKRPLLSAADPGAAPPYPGASGHTSAIAAVPMTITSSDSGNPSRE